MRFLQPAPPSFAAVLASLLILLGCRAARAADEIVVCGKHVPIGTPVVLWTDPGGYNAYRLDPPLPPKSAAAGKEPALRKRYDVRAEGLTADQRRQARNDDLRLETLQQAVDQFVLHYDVCGTSRQCFKVLQDIRGLSVHFMLDLDGTIYQTLDLKERAWHATIANHRSVGVEIANIGAYPPADVRNPLDEWYKRDPLGVYIDVPRRFGPVAWHKSNYVPRPRRSEPIVGEVNGRTLKMYDYTQEQYDSLVKLTAALCKTFPKIRCDYPRDSAGRLIPQRLPDGQLARYTGVLGHYHVQTAKSDPGPALDWDYLIHAAKRRLESREGKK